MEKFKKIIGIAAPFTRINVDTDLIVPAESLKTISRKGLGKDLFSYIRFNENGSENKKFILNQPNYKNSKVLITGKNFGCGSSREHAPWALLDFGIKCLIGSSFADIFYNNCFKNGMLPIILDEEKIQQLSQYSERKKEIEINLKEQRIMFGNSIIKFELDSFKKECLLNGLDDIALTLEKSDKISKYENKFKKNKPWIN